MDSAPIQVWPLTKIITRMAGWPHFTEDEQKDFYVSAVDALILRAKTPLCKEKWCQELLEVKGMERVIGGMEKYKNFEVNVRSALEFLIITCKKHDCIGIRCLELEILDIIDQTGELMKLHEEDEYIVEYQKVLAEILSGVALKVAQKQIGQNVKAFQCCEACGRPLDLGLQQGRRKNSAAEWFSQPSNRRSPPNSASTTQRRNQDGGLEEGGIMVLVGDKTESGNLDEPIKEQLKKVQKIVENMATFPREEAVQELGCLALLSAAKNGDMSAITKGDAVTALASAINEFPESHGIVWKVCKTAVELSNRGHAGIKSELGKKGVVAALVGVVCNFQDVQMKQLALFALGACVDQGNNFERMYDLDLEKHIKTAREQYKAAIIQLHVPDDLETRFEEYHKNHPEVPEAEPEIVDKKKGNPWDPIKPPKAKFGTADALYQGGVSGLV